MKDFTLLAPQWLWLLLLVPLWLGLFLYQQYQAKEELQKFQQQSTGQITTGTGSVVYLLALTVLIIAMARPAWNPQPKGVQDSGRDIIFLLDVSRSMLASDASPDRLTVAHNSIRQTINNLDGDRAGLVVFAGTPMIVSPLTSDRLFLNYALDKFGPQTVGLGGTQINNALMEVLNNMVDETSGPATDIIMITDGEDLGEHPREALELLNKLGSRLLVIGLGDDQFGARVPGRGKQRWTMNNGREHWSRRDDARLKALARSAHQGIYLPVGTDYPDMANILEKIRLMWPGDQRQQTRVMKYTEGYSWFLVVAGILLMVSMLRLRSTTLAAGLMILSFNARGEIPDFDALEAQAINKIEEEQFWEASDVYRRIADLAGDEKLVITANFNLGTSLVMSARQLLMQQVNPSAGDVDTGPNPLELLLEAQTIFQRILQADAHHIPSAQNLELLTEILQNQQDQSGQEGQPSGNSQQSSSAQASSRQDNNSQDNGSSADISLSEMQLAPPSQSPEDILRQARESEEKRGLKWKKQKPVEQDW